MSGLIVPAEVEELVGLLFDVSGPVTARKASSLGLGVEAISGRMGEEYHVLSWSSICRLREMAEKNKRTKPRAWTLVHTCPIRDRLEYEEYKKVLRGDD